MRGDVDAYFQLFRTRIELSQEFKDLVVKMLKYKASERPTIQQIRNSPWMRLASKN